MEKFTVYEQRIPIQIGPVLYKPNLVVVGELIADSIGEAMEKAKKQFRVNWPILSGKLVDKLVREANQKN